MFQILSIGLWKCFKWTWSHYQNLVKKFQVFLKILTICKPNFRSVTYRGVFYLWMSLKLWYIPKLIGIIHNLDKFYRYIFRHSTNRKQTQIIVKIYQTTHHVESTSIRCRFYVDTLKRKNRQISTSFRRTFSMKLWWTKNRWKIDAKNQGRFDHGDVSTYLVLRNFDERKIDIGSMYFLDQISMENWCNLDVFLL